MANTQLDTLTITLNAEVGTAKKDLNGVATSLRKLEQVGKEADWKVFEKIKKHLQGIANIDFTNVASSLRDVVSALKATGFSAKKDIDKALTTPKVSLTKSNIAVEPDWITNFGKMQEQLLKNDFAEQLNDYKRTFADIVANASNLENVTFNLRTEWEQATTNIEKVKILISSIKAGLKQSSIFTGNVTEKVAKLAMSIKRIAFYRLVRRVIQIITQAIKEGLQNLASFSEDFNGVMSNFKSSLTYFKNSIATLARPFLEVVLPLLSGLLDILSTIITEVAGLISVAFGTPFDKAKKSVEDYAESIKKAKSASLGIDELNVIKSSDVFESQDVAQLSIVSQTVNLIATILEKVSGIISRVFGFVQDILTAFQPLFDMINIIVEVLFDFIESGLPMIDDFFAIIKEVVNFVSGTLTMIFGALTGNMDMFEKGIKAMGSSLVNFFITVFEALVNSFIYVINAITGGLSKVWTWAGLPEIPKIPTVSFERISFATGGFPEDGLFFANHNELVGQFSNGKTAVANNEQITTGIYEAVLQAMQDSNNGAGNGGDIVLQLDGKEISRVAKKYDALEGNKTIKGGINYGY